MTEKARYRVMVERRRSVRDFGHVEVEAEDLPGAYEEAKRLLDARSILPQDVRSHTVTGEGWRVSDLGGAYRI